MLKGAKKSKVVNEPSPLKQFMKGPHGVEFSDYISPHYHEIIQTKQNITVGFGCVSFNNGLSQGLPIDVFTMLLTAERFRKEVIPQGGKIKVLIGDHFAYACTHESCSKETVDKIIAKYTKKIQHILSNLKISEHYEIVYSSDIVKTEEYRQIKEELEMKAQDPSRCKLMDEDTQAILEKSNKYEEGHRWYFMEQTAIFKYLFDQHDCAVKISWSRTTRGNARDQRKIRESQGFDEAHFDRFYLNMFKEQGHNLSFVYTKPGYAANIKDERSKQIPYTAPVSTEIQRVLLSKKQALEACDPLNTHLVKVVSDSATYVKTILPDLEESLRQDPKYNASYTPFYQNVFLLIKLSKNSRVANDDQCKIIEELVEPFGTLKLSDEATQVSPIQRNLGK
jgi:hypothetical protein